MKNKIIVLSLPIEDGSGIESAIVEAVLRVKGADSNITVIHAEAMDLDVMAMYEILLTRQHEAIVVSGIEGASNLVRNVVSDVVKGGG